MDRPRLGSLACAVLAHDTGMTALLMLLTAVDEGPGTCFFGVMPDHLDPFRVRGATRAPEMGPGRSRRAG